MERYIENSGRLLSHLQAFILLHCNIYVTNGRVVGTFIISALTDPEHVMNADTAQEQQSLQQILLILVRAECVRCPGAEPT